MLRRSYFRQVGVTGVLFLLSNFVSASLIQAQGQPAVMGARTRLTQKMGSGQMQGTAMNRMQNPGMSASASREAMSLNGQNELGLDSLTSFFQLGPTVVEETAGTYTHHEGAITSLTLDSSGYYVLTGSADKTAQLWRLSTDFQNGKEHLSLYQEKIFKNEDNHKLGVTDAIFSPDESMVITSSYDRSIRLWDRKEENKLVFLGAKDRVWGVAVDPYGYFIAGVINNGDILIWQPKPPEIIGRFTLPKTKDNLNIPIYDVNFDSTGEYLVVACADGSVRLWYIPAIINKNNLQLKKQLEKKEAEKALEDDSNETHSVSNNSTPFDFMQPSNSGEKRQFGESLIIRGHGVNGDQVDPEPFVYSAVFSNDNSCILTAGRDKTARIWDSRTGLELCRFVGHTGAVRKAIFYGNYVLTASDDGTVRIWSYSLQNSYGSDNRMNNAGMLGPDSQSMGPYSPGMTNNNQYMSSPNMSSPIGNKGPVGLPQGPVSGGISGSAASPTNPGPMIGPIGPSASMGNQSGLNMQQIPLPQRQLGINKGTELVCFKADNKVSVFSVGITADAYYVLGGCSDGVVRIWQNPLVQSYSNLVDPNASGYGSGGYGVSSGNVGSGYGTGMGMGTGTGMGTYAPGNRGNSPSNYPGR
ncbi:MAG: WD40 repeat domain-containing protein [Planctomycetia bacterium]|nr:WD40 repeat domain-containing protein [Planctomycetia bacterium]